MDQLPFDILFQFLVSLQDLQSLRATTLTSKKFWDAFQANQNTILHSILGYELGPTALVHARALYHANTCRSSNATDDCFVSPQKYFKGPIACKEARALSHYGCTARRLAAYFTTLYKDRSAPGNALTEREFFYFQRALFRYWILDCFTTRTGWEKASSRDQIGFVYEIPVEEAEQLGDVHTLLYRLARWRYSAVYTIGEGLEHYPDEVLQRLDDQVHSPVRALPQGEQLSIRLNEFYYSVGIHGQNIWTRSRMPTGMAILVDGRNHSLQCPRCNASPVILWGESNLHVFRCFNSIHYLLHGMPGKLGFSMQLYFELGQLRDTPHCLPTVYREILDIKHGNADDWNSDTYLCEVCLSNCMKRNIYQWYVQRMKASSGPNVKPNCPVGWDCNLLYLRTHDHESEFNHFCPPTSNL